MAVGVLVWIALLVGLVSGSVRCRPSWGGDVFWLVIIALIPVGGAVSFILLSARCFRRLLMPISVALAIGVLGIATAAVVQVATVGRLSCTIVSRGQEFCTRGATHPIVSTSVGLVAGGVTLLATYRNPASRR